MNSYMTIFNDYIVFSKTLLDICFFVILIVYVNLCMFVCECVCVSLCVCVSASACMQRPEMSHKSLRVTPQTGGKTNSASLG